MCVRLWPAILFYFFPESTSDNTIIKCVCMFFHFHFFDRRHTVCFPLFLIINVWTLYLLGVSLILTKSIIQHKCYIDIHIEITHNISIISPDFMVASFINERGFKTYNIVQYSPENDVLYPSYGSSHFGWAEILVCVAQKLMKWLHK